ncbi:hypothetical protein J1614_001962 [Plenodomus biglobosus]|nr:hypothetical protein J1614_001962 [Plenodomus biglobosus]
MHLWGTNDLAASGNILGLQSPKAALPSIVAFRSQQFYLGTTIHPSANIAQQSTYPQLQIWENETKATNETLLSSKITWGNFLQYSSRSKFSPQLHLKQRTVNLLAAQHRHSFVKIEIQ